jgi:hypothetical protein
MNMVTVTAVDGHGHGDGRLKRSGTIWNEVKRSGTDRNEVKRNETVDHGHGTFPAKKERFTVEQRNVLKYSSNKVNILKHL